MYKTNYSVFFNFSVSNCSGLMIPDTIISGKVPQERCSMSKEREEVLPQSSNMRQLA